RLQLWDLSGVEPIRRLEEPGIHLCNFRNDGLLVALAHLDGTISVYETASGKRVHRLASGPIVLGLWPQLHPTAPFVACNSYFYPDVQIRDLRSGEVVASAKGPGPNGIGGCAWSRDGRTLNVTSGDGRTIQQCAFDPAAPTLQPIRTLEGSNA